VIVVEKADNFGAAIARVEQEVTDVRCTLAAAGIAPTTTPCTLAPLRAPERGR